MQKSNALETTRDQSRKPEYIYYWNRILGASGVFLLLVGFAAYGLYSWFTSPPPQELDVTQAMRPIMEAAPNHLMNAEEMQTPLLDEEVFVEDGRIQQLVESKPQETESATPEVDQLTAEIDVDEVVHGDAEPVEFSPIVEEMVAMPAEGMLSKLQTSLSQDMPLEHHSESSNSADRAPSVDTIPSPFRLKELKILEPKIKRFLLTKSISNREPHGELDEIRFNVDGSAVIWAYSECVDKKDSLLKYVWRYEGKTVASVPAAVRGDRWRSYSSKTINHRMSGAWRVELQDGEDRLMASADFFL
jgi:hypothetical protein